MIFSLTCLSTGLEDYDSEFVLDADENKFLFNVRDGTQRLCSEHAIRLSRVKAIFISRISPHTLGGLPGMLLSIYDMGVHELTLYGPEGLGEYITSLQLFIFRKDYCINVIEIEKDIETIDLHNGAFVYPFVVSPNQQTEFFQREVIHQESYVNLTLSLIRRETPCLQSEISYVIDIPTIQGKFCPQKAKELGIPSGPLYKELVSGKSITFNNRVITSDMVMTSASRGPSVLLLNAHSKAVALLIEQTYHSIIERFGSSLLAIYQNNSPSVILNSPEFQKTIKHFSLPFSYSPIVHTASTFVCKRLHTLFPTLFPDLKVDETIPKYSNNNYPIIARTTMKLAPLKGQGVVTFPTITNDQPAIRPEEEQVSAFYTSLLSQQTSSSLKGKITFLGTGSAVPSKYRNVSSLLYQLPQCTMLLDCGEGTVNQLLRLYPLSFLQSINIIIISHSHADHHLGLPLLFDCLYGFMNNNEHERRQKIEKEPILLFAPKRVKVFLDIYAKFVPWIQEVYTFVEICHSSTPAFNPPVEVIPECIKVLQNMKETAIPASVEKQVLPNGLIHFVLSSFSIQLSFFPMVHCDDSTAVLIQSPKENILFTGDGRPAYQFKNYFDSSINVDVLVNESTFTKDRQDHAEQKKHCTMEEALELASSIHAKYTILTHFSQRYPKNLLHDQGLKESSAVSLEERAGDYQTFVCAHDLMTIQLKDLSSLCKIRDAFEDCFVDDDD